MATKDYQKIARERMYRPSQGPKKRPKILIYARNKKGKSKLTASAGENSIIVLDPEYGLDKNKKDNPHLWPIREWEDIDDFYKWIRTDPYCVLCGFPGDFADRPKHKFIWVGVDGLTRIANMSLNYVMRVAEEKDLDRQPGMVSQRDYGKSGELMKQFFKNLDTLPQGVIYTAQERQDAPFTAEEDDDAEDVTATLVADLPKGVRGAINGWVDVIGRLYVVQIETADGKRKPQRRLWIGPSDNYDTGYRSDYELPPMIKNPTIPKLVKLMRDGELTAKKKETRP